MSLHALGPNFRHPNHHLWKNHGVWFINYTRYPNGLTKERVRHSLRTRCLITARLRRDNVLAALQARGVLAVRGRRRLQTVAEPPLIAIGGC